MRSCPSPPSIGAHSWCSAAKGSSRSDSAPIVPATRRPLADSAAYSSRAVLPTPGSPRRTSLRPRPLRTSASNRSSAFRSRERPTNNRLSLIASVTEQTGKAYAGDVGRDKNGLTLGGVARAPANPSGVSARDPGPGRYCTSNAVPRPPSATDSELCEDSLGGLRGLPVQGTRARLTRPIFDGCEFFRRPMRAAG